MQTTIRTNEDQLNREIVGLTEQIEKLSGPNGVPAKRAQSFLKQVLKSKLEQRATLRYQREHASH